MMMMKVVWLSVLLGGLGGCSYGEMLDTIPASQHQPYQPSSPPAVQIMSPTPEETSFLLANACMQCREGDRFHRFIHGDPDVRKSRIPRNTALADDAGMAKKQWVDEVRTAVYFSKHIRLANGETLFRLIQQCSSGWDSPQTQAVASRQNKVASGFDIQYLIRFKKYGQPIGLEMRAAFIRRGRDIQADNPFADALLRDPDFMQANQLRCWKD
jgi:hypothetical protein